MFKIEKIWRNDGGYATLFVEFENATRLEIRLFNEWEQDIQLEAVTVVGKKIIQIDNASYIEVESDIIGKEFNLFPILYGKKLVDGVKSVEDIKSTKYGRVFVFKDFRYPESWGNGEIKARETKNKEIENMLQSFFEIAYRESEKMIIEWRGQ